MPKHVYETHVVKDPLLPFIFHKDTLIGQLSGNYNWHKNIELLYCTAGEGFVKLDSTVHPIEPDDIIVINSDTLHTTGAPDFLVYHCLIIDSVFCLSNGIDVEKLRFQERIQDPALRRIFDCIVDAFSIYRQDDSLANMLVLRIEILRLLCALCQNYIADHASSSVSTSSIHIRDVITYIRQNLARSFTLDDISDYVGISKFHLAREFKAFTGTSIFDFVNLMRCNEAKNLIESGTPVSVAAINCGFSNLSYFSRAFKKRFHVLPSHYVKR